MRCCLCYVIGIIRVTLQGHLYKPTLIELSICYLCVFMGVRLGRPTRNAYTSYNIQKLVRVIDIGKRSIKARAYAPRRCVQTYNYVFKCVYMYCGTAV